MQKGITSPNGSLSGSSNILGTTNLLPKVLLIGGPDVDARVELMHRLKDTFNVGALGSSAALQEKFLPEGFAYHTYHLSRRTNPLLDLFTVGELTFILRRLKPQIIHTFDTKPGVWARIAARLAGVPVVLGTLTGLGSLYAGNSTKTKLLRLIYEPLQKFACRISDRTVFQNHDDARQLISAGVVSNEKAEIILGSGVSTEVYDPTLVSEAEVSNLRNELGIQLDHLVVTMISRVIRSKGVPDFIYAAKTVADRYPNVRFLLVGPEDNDSVDRLSAAELAELKQAVIWPGARRDVRTLLAASDIFVLPSAYREGIPRVLLEAASMGLPIVTTNSPGCNEIARDGVNGFLVPVSDPIAFTEAILRLIEQPELRRQFGKTSRQRAVEHFDLTVIANQTISLYQRLLPGS